MFVTLEGIDASGKSTQLELLKRALKERGFDVLATRQPGGTPIGRQIREVILSPVNSEMVAETEVLLYMADRLQHLCQVVRPALDKGKIVLCDRYHDATVVYQGAGRRLDLSWLRPIEKKYLIRPDLTLWLDISLEESLDRLERRNRQQGIENCRLESEDREFFKRVVAKYRELCEKESDRFVRIAAEENSDTIQKSILAALMPKLKENG